MDMQAARDELISAIGEIGTDDWHRFVPYGSRTLRDLLAHLATADQRWAVAARGLLKGESEERSMLRTARGGAGAAAQSRSSPDALIEEMNRRRKLLLTLFELLEPRHLAIGLKSFGEEHNSVRERIWLGYHDRMHAADIRRALRMRWHPAKLQFLPQVEIAVSALSPDETLYVIYSVDPVFWEKPSPVPGWTYRNLLAHMATGDWVLQRHLRNIVETGTVADWPDVAAGNARLLDERKHSTHAMLTDEYLSMRHETMLLLAQLKPAHLDLALQFWWEPAPNEHTVLEYVTMFESHDRQHREQLRRAMKYAR
jgi:Mycothiol maleylpyruvate isomerase N-terminal domain